MSSGNGMDVDEEKKASSSSLFVFSTAFEAGQKRCRDACVFSDDILVTAAEDGTIVTWARHGNTFTAVSLNPRKVHNGICYHIGPVPSHLINMKDCLISGGGDNQAYILTSQFDPVVQFNGHTGPVGSFAFTMDGRVITGCWDGKTRIFNGQTGECLSTASGHMYATEVLLLHDQYLISGSGNFEIHISKLQKGASPLKQVKVIPKAHKHIIRKLAAHPLGFASAGNDGLVKVWSLDGSQIMQIDAHSQSDVAFIYSFVMLSSGEFVTSGDDRTIKVFSVDGKETQTIVLPAPARSLKVLPNGDILAVCVDTNRIFTRSKSRHADAQALTQFEEISKASQAAGYDAVDLSNCKEMTTLLYPGKKDGETLMVNVECKPFVYQWSSDKVEWVLLGEAMGKSKKTEKKDLFGVMYDEIIDVELQPGYPPLKLGFNRDDDPDEVATRFINVNGLSVDYKQEIVNFLMPHINMEAVRKRQEDKEAAAAAAKLIHIPSWVSGGAHIEGTAKVQLMKAAILKTNGEFVDAKSLAYVLNESDLKSLDVLIANLNSAVTYHSAPFSSGEEALMRKLLQWPTVKVLPVLDAYRILMCHSAANDALANDAAIMKLLFQHVNEQAGATPTHVVLVLKALGNWVAKRKKTAGERADPVVVPQAILVTVMQCLDEFSECVSHKEEKIRNAFAMFAYNVINWYGRLNVKEDASEADIYVVVATALLEILNRTENGNDKVFFYALLTVGSACYTSINTRDMLASGFGDEIMKFIQQCKASSTLALRQLGDDIAKVFGAK